MSYDVVALGETMIALAPPAGRGLCDTDALVIDHAGAESNTCVGLARLGLRTAWVSRLGADAFGDRIVAALEAEGVDTRWVRRDPSRPTGMMVKDPDAGVRYYRTGSAASAMTSDDLAGVAIDQSRAVLVSGVTALIGPGPHEAGLAFLAASRGLRIVDPNLRPSLWGSSRRRELVLPFIERCDLLLAGSQELAELLDVSVGRDGGGDGALQLAREAASRGPREIVLRGSGTIVAHASDGSMHTLEIMREAAVDPIGAGDAFNAGYIAVRLRGGSIDEALAMGARCGAAVTTAMSDTAGFPRL